MTKRTSDRSTASSSASALDGRSLKSITTLDKDTTFCANFKFESGKTTKLPVLIKEGSEFRHYISTRATLRKRKVASASGASMEMDDQTTSHLNAHEASSAPASDPTQSKRSGKRKSGPYTQFHGRMARIPWLLFEAIEPEKYGILSLVESGIPEGIDATNERTKLVWLKNGEEFTAKVEKVKWISDAETSAGIERRYNFTSGYLTVHFHQPTEFLLNLKGRGQVSCLVNSGFSVESYLGRIEKLRGQSVIIDPESSRGDPVSWGVVNRLLGVKKPALLQSEWPDFPAVEDHELDIRCNALHEYHSSTPLFS